MGGSGSKPAAQFATVSVSKPVVQTVTRTTTTSQGAPAVLAVPASSHQINQAQSLVSPSCLRDPSGTYTFCMQSDGNVVGSQGSRPFWASNTNGRGVGPYRLTMQADGNLVAYDSTNKAIWASNTNGKGVAPYYFVMQADRNAVIYGAKGATWATNTNIVVVANRVVARPPTMAPIVPVTNSVPQVVNTVPMAVPVPISTTTLLATAAPVSMTVQSSGKYALTPALRQAAQAAAAAPSAMTCAALQLAAVQDPGFAWVESQQRQLTSTTNGASIFSTLAALAWGPADGTILFTGVSACQGLKPATPAPVQSAVTSNTTGLSAGRQYYIQSVPRGSACASFLSVQDCTGDSAVDFWTASGINQAWWLGGTGQANTFNLLAAGRSGCPNILSVQPCTGTSPRYTLVSQPTVTEQFTFIQVPNVPNTFYIQSVGRSGCNNYMSVQACGNGANTYPDQWNAAGVNQAFLVTPVPGS